MVICKKGGDAMDDKTNLLRNKILEKYNSILAFSRKSGIPYTTLISALNKGIGGTSLKTVVEICRILDLDIRYLLPGKHPETMSSYQKKLVLSYNELDAFGKEAVDSILSIELKRIKNINKKFYSEISSELVTDKTIPLKFSLYKASAGDGFDLCDGAFVEERIVALNELTKKADYCIKVSGNSMEPVFHNKDYILIHEQPAVDLGEIGLFAVNGKGFVKKFGVDCLISLNENYDDIILNEYDTVCCYGKVIGRLENKWIK